MDPQWAVIAAWVMASLFMLDTLVGFFWCPNTTKQKFVRFLVVLASVLAYALCQSNADKKDCAA
jgi:hypothetical protein